MRPIGCAQGIVAGGGGTATSVWCSDVQIAMEHDCYGGQLRDKWNQRLMQISATYRRKHQPPWALLLAYVFLMRHTAPTVV